MLIIEAVEALDPRLLPILQEVKKRHISRYPIIAACSSLHIGFHDSRMPRSTRIAWLRADYNDKGEPGFLVTSNRIENAKYAKHNRKYRTKFASDPMRAAKTLRDVLHPLTPQEMADMTSSVAQNHYDLWRGKAQEESSAAIAPYVNPRAVMAEVVRMVDVGYVPQTEAFRNLLEKGLPLWQERQRRYEQTAKLVHVCINPDGSVELFTHDDVGPIARGKTFVPTLEETPEVIQQHVAVLRMVEDNTHVPEVGTRVDSTRYWVEVLGGSAKA